MKSYVNLLLENKSWAQEKKLIDPDYFTRLSLEQKPDYLWIGCSDSRVPANEITNTDPGEMFVHRNIANLVIHTDLNLLSVLQYAVEVLKVKHVIVCGHYGCGGVKAAMQPHRYGLIDQWLLNIKDVYFQNRNEIQSIEDEKKRVDRMVELNVISQVQNLVQTDIIQESWKNCGKPMLHGWVYDIHDGILRSLIEVDPNSEVDPVYRYDLG